MNDSTACVQSFIRWRNLSRTAEACIVVNEADVVPQQLFHSTASAIKTFLMLTNT